ncbi:MAG: hypothetical protein IKP99_04590 [Bacteroidales bacterium]|nr:hypothetical protein [Bacteroidales bacterium]
MFIYILNFTGVVKFLIYSKMAKKYTKEEYENAKKQKEELFELILKKTGVSKKDLFDVAKQEFIVANLDVVTAKERKKFPDLVFGL